MAKKNPQRLQPSETPPWTPEPVCDPGYWKARLDACDGEIHRSVFNGSIDQFSPLEADHRQALADEVRPDDAILDAGCGYGRLYRLLPQSWRGQYIGADISPDLINEARRRYGEASNRWFALADLRELPFRTNRFDLAVVCSIREMIRRNLGEPHWQVMEAEIHRVARRVLYLGYGRWD